LPGAGFGLGIGCELSGKRLCRLSSAAVKSSIDIACRVYYWLAVVWVVIAQGSNKRSYWTRFCFAFLASPFIFFFFFFGLPYL